MASEVIGKYLLISRPNYQPGTKLWDLYSFVLWQDGKDLHSQLGQNFQTEKQAEFFGFAACHKWIDGQCAELRESVALSRQVVAASKTLIAESKKMRANSRRAISESHRALNKARNL